MYHYNAILLKMFVPGANYYEQLEQASPSVPPSDHKMTSIKRATTKGRAGKKTKK